MIYKIENIVSKEIFEVENLQNFCNENGITKRNLAYTNPKFKNTANRYTPVYKKTWRILEECIVNDKYDEREDGVVKKLAVSMKTIQKLRDEIRIERRVHRENNRDSTVIEALTRDLKDIISRNKSNIKTSKHDIIDVDAPKGIVQWSDLHGNEQVDMIGNVYNWEELSKRIKKHTQENIRLFKSMKVSDIVIAQTGDLLNSDRRLGEILTNSTNRAKALFIISEILTQSILEYNQHFNVNIASIIGNESRIDEDIFFEEQLASNNFDFVINRLIYIFLMDKEGIKFIPNTNPLEEIIEVNGQNILILHGHTLKGKNPQGSISRVKEKYADKGILIRFIMFGHIHETSIGSNSARSGSTVGDNAYSFYGLHCSGRASQNSYVVYKDGSIHSFAIDLQNANEYDPYIYDTDLESYKNKSLEKFKTENGIKIYRV